MPAATAIATPRVKSIQRTALLVPVASGVINHIDRATLAAANPLIREKLGLSIAQMACLLSAFLWAYALSQFPTEARVVRDWFNPRDRGLAAGVFNCASTLGAAIALPLLTFLALHLGWRATFVAMGVAGMEEAAGQAAVPRLA